MKIELFFITYKNDPVLIKTLDSLKDSGNFEDLNQVTIINNHSDFKINLNNYPTNLRVIHNSGRPDFAESGYLARSWNQCLLFGFENLLKPKNDIVITCQNDIKFKKNWLQGLIEYHIRYNFITFGIGDSFLSYTPSSIMNIGMWDERFNCIQFHEFDYCLRASLYNKNHSSINSFGKRFDFNKLENTVVDDFVSGYNRDDPIHLRTLKYGAGTRKLFHTKWGIDCFDIDYNTVCEPKILNHILYPYFEKNIPKETLDRQKYLYLFDENQKNISEKLRRKMAKAEKLPTVSEKLSTVSEKKPVFEKPAGLSDTPIFKKK